MRRGGQGGALALCREGGFRTYSVDRLNIWRVHSSNTGSSTVNDSSPSSISYLSSSPPGLLPLRLLRKADPRAPGAAAAPAPPTWRPLHPC